MKNGNLQRRLECVHRRCCVVTRGPLDAGYEMHLIITLMHADGITVDHGLNHVAQGSTKMNDLLEVIGNQAYS